MLVEEHWYVPLLGFHISTQEFYAAVEKELTQRKVPDLEISRVEFAEGGLLSARRQYLRLQSVSDFYSTFVPHPLEHRGFSHYAVQLFSEVLDFGKSRSWPVLLRAYFLFWSTFGLFLGSLAIVVSIVAVCSLLYLAQRWQGLDDALMELPIIGVIYEAFFHSKGHIIARIPG